VNPVTQSGLYREADHPDANVLNAFVEHALQEGERARVVAHMAECARCREVVFLARSAAQPEVAPAPAVRAEPKPSRFAVAFAKWRVALIPAAALAAVGATVLWVQVRPAMERTEMAKVLPPPAAATSQSVTTQMAARRAAPAPGDRQTEAREPVASPPKQAERIIPSQAKKAAVPSGGIVAMERSIPPVSPSGAPEGAGQDGALGPIHLDGRSASTAGFAPRPQPLPAPPASAFSKAHGGPQWQQAVAPPKTAAQAPVTVEASAAPVVPSPAPPPPNIVTSAGVAPPVVTQSVVVEPLPRTELAPQALNGLAVLRLARFAKLPSGLNTVSSAALLNRLVAVDSGGGVFLSQDGGQHWQRVRARWTGKAVRVQAPPQNFSRFMIAAPDQAPEKTALSGQPVPASTPEEAANAPASASPADENSSAGIATVHAGASIAPPLVPTEFKLLTDRHEVWVSADGKVWRMLGPPPAK
jgi:hypothetical protein